MAGNVRGLAPVRPGDTTGRLYQQQQKARMDALKATRDIDQEIKAAHAKGWNEGWDAAVAYLIERYDLDADDFNEDYNSFSGDGN
jgi:hypothetical protein